MGRCYILNKIYFQSEERKQIESKYTRKGNATKKEVFFEKFTGKSPYNDIHEKNAHLIGWKQVHFSFLDMCQVVTKV